MSVIVASGGVVQATTVDAVVPTSLTAGISALFAESIIPSALQALGGMQTAIQAIAASMQTVAQTALTGILSFVSHVGEWLADYVEFKRSKSAKALGFERDQQAQEKRRAVIATLACKLRELDPPSLTTLVRCLSAAPNGPNTNPLALIRVAVGIAA